MIVHLQNLPPNLVIATHPRFNLTQRWSQLNPMGNPWSLKEYVQYFVGPWTLNLHKSIFDIILIPLHIWERHMPIVNWCNSRKVGCVPQRTCRKNSFHWRKKVISQLINNFGPENILDSDNAEMTRFQVFSHSTTQVHEENPMLTFCWTWCHFNLMSAPKTTEIIRWKFLLFRCLSISTKTVDHAQGDRFVRSPVVTQDSLLYGPTDMHPLIAVRKSAWHSSSGFLASTLLSSNLSDLCRPHPPSLTLAYGWFLICGHFVFLLLAHQNMAQDFCRLISCLQPFESFGWRVKALTCGPCIIKS